MLMGSKKPEDTIKEVSEHNNIIIVAFTGVEISGEVCSRSNDCCFTLTLDDRTKSQIDPRIEQMRVTKTGEESVVVENMDSQPVFSAEVEQIHIE